MINKIGVHKAMGYLLLHKGYCDQHCRAILGNSSMHCDCCPLYEQLCDDAGRSPEIRLIFIKNYVSRHPEDFLEILL